MTPSVSVFLFCFRLTGRYLVILHLWALFILSFHTHRLDIDSSGADSGAAALPTPADHPFVQNAP